MRTIRGEGVEGYSGPYSVISEQGGMLSYAVSETGESNDLCSSSEVLLT